MRYEVVHNNISVLQTNHIATARTSANWQAVQNKGEIVHIYYRGDSVERYHVGPIGKVHWQANDFVTNTINLPTLDGGDQMVQNMIDNLKRKESSK